MTAIGADGGDRLVLVVEDNEKNRKLARDLLGFRGFRVAEAPTSTDALLLAQAEPPLDGVEVLRLLRDDPLTTSIPVVAVTAFAMNGDRERLLAEGFDGYVAKPIDARSFVDGLLAVLDGRDRL